MLPNSGSSSRSLRVVLGFVLFFLSAVSTYATTRTLIISRVYGGSTATSNSPSDYIELFNGSPAPINLKYFTIQQQGGQTVSTFGSSGRIALPDFVLQPGQYFLLRGVTQSANPNAFPLTPDYQFSAPDLPTTSAKLGLVFSNALLPACGQTGGTTTADPPASNNLVDFVGFGNAGTSFANCAEGSNPAPSASSTRAVYRTDVCNDTNNNGNDWSSETSANSVAKHNSATTPTPCYTGGDAPQIAASYTPSTAYATLPILFTAAMTAATNPAGTSMRVQADLSGLGGSATQMFYDDGTHGDVTAGDNIFSYRITVPATQAAGSVMVPVTGVDDYFRVAGQTLTVDIGGTLPTTTPIHTVQAAVPSAYQDQSVSVEGIVTAVTSAGFYLQAAAAANDSDPNTSEAIFVATATLPTDAVVGNDLIVTGTVLSGTVNTLGGTLSVIKVSGSNSLPAAVTIASTDADSLSAPANMRKFEAMRVSIASATAVSPESGAVAADGTVSAGATAWAVISPTARTFREAGAAVSDALPSGSPATVTRWDENLERVLLVGNAFGSNLLANVAATQTLSSASGILEFASGVPNILLSSVSAGSAPGDPAALAAAGDTSFAVASLNLVDLYDATADGGEAEVLSPANLDVRLGKASAQIRTLLATPDVVAVQGIENLATLQALAARIGTDAVAASQADPAYQAYLVEGTDPSRLNVGYLVRTVRATVVGSAQEGVGATYINPSTSASSTLFTQPPYVLKLGVKQTGNQTYLLTLINVSLLSRDGISDATTGVDVRAHREAQAEAVAQMVQSHQAAGEHVVVAGGFNAYQFADGYVDVVGAIAGTPADATTVVTPSPSNIIASPLTNLSAGVVDSLLYSNIEAGNAAATDHMLVSSSLASGSTAVYLHANADYPEILRTSSSTATRVSSHDAVLAYLAVPQLQSAVLATLSPTTYDFGNQPVSSQASQAIQLTNAGTSTLNLTNISLSGAGFTQTNNCGASVAAGQSCTLTVVFAPGAAQAYSGTLTVTDNAPDSPQTVTLSGTGVVTTAVASPTALAFGDVVVGGVVATKTTIITNTGSSVLSITDASIGGWPGSVTNNCSSVVAAGSTCTVVVSYSPTATGNATGTLTLQGNLAAPISVTLTGNGIPAVPKAVFNPTTLNFGDQTTAISSSVMSVSMSNPGTGPLTILSIAASGDYSQTNNCPASLAIDASCTISVVFTPTTTGTRAGAITVVDDASPATQTVTLSGNGIVPMPTATITGGPLAFADTLATQATAAQSITVSNHGYAPLTFTSISASANFAISAAGTTCSIATSIAVGSSCTVAVIFAPVNGGTLTGTLNLVDNAPNSPQAVLLSGNGIDFTLSPSSTGGNALTVSGGTIAQYSLALTPQSYSGTVALSCANGTLPTYVVCSVSPTSTSLVAGTPKTVTVTVVTYSKTVSEIVRKHPTGGIISFAALFAGFGLFGLRHRRSNLLRLCCGLFLFFVASVGFIGCSAGYNKGADERTNPYTTPSGTYSLSVTATSTTNGVTLTHTQNLTLTVQ